MSGDDARVLANLMGMAGTAEAAGNNGEAISYYNRVLEADPRYSAAWLGKGRAAGGLSTLSDLRLQETIVCFGHAIATAPDHEKADVSELASVEVNLLATQLYTMSLKHLTEFVTVPSAQKLFCNVNARLIDALVEALRWTPSSRPVLERIVAITRTLLSQDIGEPLRSVLRTRFNESTAAIAAQDPTYQPPQMPVQLDAPSIRTSTAGSAPTAPPNDIAEQIGKAIGALVVLGVIFWIFISMSQR